jgi:hypothetical protein
MRPVLNRASYRQIRTTADTRLDRTALPVKKLKLQESEGEPAKGLNINTGWDPDPCTKLLPNEACYPSRTFLKEDPDARRQR